MTAPSFAPDAASRHPFYFCLLMLLSARVSRSYAWTRDFAAGLFNRKSGDVPG